MKNEAITWIAGCLVAIAVVGCIAYIVTIGMANDLTLKKACTEAGGIMTYDNRCAWSKVQK